MDLIAFVKYRLANKNFIHDFSLGALFGYHKLDKLLLKDGVVFNESYVLLKTNKLNNLIVYDLFDELKQTIKNTDLNKKLKVSASFPIPLLGESKKRKQEEIFYQLQNINKSHGKKKYHSYLKPIRIFEQRPDLGLEIRSVSDIAGQAGLIELHNEWVKYKLSLPKTHRISFPTARYRNTLEEMPIPVYKKAIYIKDKLYGFIVFSLENQVAFELAFCTLFWKPEFKILNGLNQYIFSYCCIQLQKHGIKFVNSGFALNKNLKIFKTTSQEANSIFRHQYEL